MICNIYCMVRRSISCNHDLPYVIWYIVWTYITNRWVLNSCCDGTAIKKHLAQHNSKLQRTYLVHVAPSSSQSTRPGRSQLQALSATAEPPCCYVELATSPARPGQMSYLLLLSNEACTLLPYCPSFEETLPCSLTSGYATLNWMQNTIWLQDHLLLSEAHGLYILSTVAGIHVLLFF